MRFHPFTATHQFAHSDSGDIFCSTNCCGVSWMEIISPSGQTGRQHTEQQQLLLWCQPSVRKPWQSSLSQNGDINTVNHPASTGPLCWNPLIFSYFPGTVVIVNFSQAALRLSLRRPAHSSLQEHLNTGSCVALSLTWSLQHAHTSS